MTTEDEMVGWHHGLNRHEFEWTPQVGDGRIGGSIGVFKSQTLLRDRTEVN